MPSSKLSAYVGFSIKSRKIVFGYDNVTQSKRVLLVIAVPDINRTAKNELVAYCEEHRIPLAWCEEALFAECVHRVGCKCVGLTDASLAKAAEQELKRINAE